MKTNIDDAVLVFNTRKEVQSRLLKMGLLSTYSGKEKTLYVKTDLKQPTILKKIKDMGLFISFKISVEYSVIQKVRKQKRNGKIKRASRG